MAEQDTDGSTKVSLTHREVEHLLSAIRSLKHDPLEIDLERFQVETGLTSIGGTRNAWVALKKKVLCEVKPLLPGVGGEKAPKQPKTPRTTSKDTNAAASTGRKQATKKQTKQTNTSPHAAVQPESNEPVKSDIEMEEAINLQAEGEHSDGQLSETIIESIERDEPVDVETGPVTTMTDMSPPQTPTPAAPKTKPESSVKAKPEKATKATPKAKTAKKTAVEKEDANPTNPSQSTVAPASLPPSTPKQPSNTVPSALSSSKKRSRKANVEKDAEGNEDEGESHKPAKKPRKTPIKKSTKKAESDMTDDIANVNGEAQVQSKPEPKKRAGRKPKDTASTPNGKTCTKTAEKQDDEDEEDNVAAENGKNDGKDGGDPTKEDQARTTGKHTKTKQPELVVEIKEKGKEKSKVSDNSLRGPSVVAPSHSPSLVDGDKFHPTTEATDTNMENADADGEDTITVNTGEEEREQLEDTIEVMV